MSLKAAVLAAGVVLAAGSAATAQTIEDARTAVERGDPRLAVAILDKLVAARPDDTDLLRRLAAAQAAEGDYAAARTTIERAVTNAPSDLDLRAARARIMFWAGDSEGARGELAQIIETDPAYPEVEPLQAMLARPSSPGPRGGLSAAFGVSGIETAGGRQTWTSAVVAGYRSIGDGQIVAAEVTQEDRRRSDTHFAAMFETRVGDGLVRLRATGTPDADFREQWSVGAGGEREIGAGFTALMDVRHAHYALASVSVIEPGARYSFAEGRGALTARWINLFAKGEPARSGASLRGDYDLGRGRSIYAGAAGYPDTEAGVTRQVRAFFVGGTAPLTDRVSLRAGVEYDRRVSSYTRRAATLGLSWRFGG